MEGLLAISMVLFPVAVLSAPGRLCDGSACNVDWTPVPNMDAALVGYNPVLSNTLLASDPGMKATIFAPTFTRPAPDNRVEVNPNILYFDDIHCQMSRSTQVVSSYQEYAKQRTGSFKFQSTETKSSSFKIPLFSLLINYERKQSETKSSSTDSSFQNDVKFFKEQGGEVYLNQAKCQVFKVQIDDFAKPVFSDGFVRAIKVLADEAADPKRHAKKAELRRFIRNFGTHYLSKSWLGATLTVESRFTRQSTSQSERNQRRECIGSAYGKSVNQGVRMNTFDVKVAKGDSEVSTKVGGQGGDIGNGSGESKLNCSSMDALKKGGAGSSFKGVKVTSVGSYPASDTDEWAKTAGNNPRVIDFELKPIANLFRSYFLDEIDGLKGKAPIMKKYFEDAVKEYCLTMLGEECPETKGCGYQDLCPIGVKCFDDKSNSLGYVCRSDCLWGSWGPWGNTCSINGKTEVVKGTRFCGSGQVSRTRTKTGPFFGGKPCSGSNTQTRDCSVKDCQYKSAGEGTDLKLQCDGGKKIEIIKAEYGADYHCKSSIFSYLEVRERCDGKSQCSYPAGNNRFGDPCHGRKKQLSVWYKCINPGIVKSGGLWREDRRCGKGFTLSDGVTQAECSRWSPGSKVEHGHGPCCSGNGWCGNSAEYCRCTNCVDYSTACATIFEQGDFRGWSHYLPESSERYNLPSDFNRGASVKVAPGCIFVPYWHGVGGQDSPLGHYKSDTTFNIQYNGYKGYYFQITSYKCICKKVNTCYQWTGKDHQRFKTESESQVCESHGHVFTRGNNKDFQNCKDKIGNDCWCCKKEMCDGGDSCCGANGHKCGEGEGDCDSDSDCQNGLTCGLDNCVGDSFEETDDCCELK